MSPAHRLATFVHISDLHIGDRDPQTGQAVYPPWLEQAWTDFPQFTGLAGHDRAVMNDLGKWWRELRAREGARLIVTGDLTAYGSADQYEAAVLFLAGASAEWELDGLEEPQWESFGISGNHDHWGGTFLGLGRDPWRQRMFWVHRQLQRVSGTWSQGKVGRVVGLLSAPLAGVLRQFLNRPAPPVARWLGRFPFVSSPDPLPGTELCLRWLALDTDAEVYPVSPGRLLARGSFCGQLNSLRKKRFPAAAPNEIRVLLLHHSPAHHGTQLGIDRPSRRALADFVADYHVRVLLTGHIHKVVFNQGLGVLEARCGTTTQVSRVTLTRPNGAGEWEGRLDPNTLLVHRLFREGHRIVWETRSHEHIMSKRGFSETGAVTRLTVWEPSGVSGSAP
jgi:hypothetical protein